MRVKSLPIVSAIFLVIAMMVQFFVSYHREKEGLKRHIEYKMELAQKNFIFEVYDMHEATEEIRYFFPEFYDNPDDLYSLLRTVLSHYPELYSCYVSFLPAYSIEVGKRFAPCAFRVHKDSIRVYDFSDNVNYLERDWYTGALQSDKNGYWSLPYNDGDFEDLVFTHSQKVFDSKGNMVGVVGVDYTLVWTKQLLEDIKPYNDAVCQLFSVEGQLIVESGNITHLHKMIVLEKVLSPMNMRLVIGVPKRHISDEIAWTSLLTFVVLLIGIVVLGAIIRHLWRNQKEYARVETSNQLMERELHIASRIQAGMLRHDFPDDDTVTLEATLLPMHEVGGDLYDYFRKDDDLYFIIGDVSGKGVPATMFMASTVNLFRSFVRHYDSPKSIVEEMNAVLSENNPSCFFITAFVGKLHIPSGELLYCNAAHPPPLIISHINNLKHHFLLVEPNIPMGYISKYRYLEQGFMMERDEVLLLYTDGITETRNTEHRMFGKDRLQKIACEAPYKQMEEFVFNAITTFRDAAEQGDDITLMTIRRKENRRPVHIQIKNRLDQWGVLRNRLRQFCICAGMSHSQLVKMEIALEEAVINIIHYAYPVDTVGEIEMEIQLYNVNHKQLSVVLTDRGIAFDPLHVAVHQITDSADRRIGGLGIVLLKQIADELRYTRTDDGKNKLTILKNI